jgi:DNA-binding PadR family transcriptional regulator
MSGVDLLPVALLYVDRQKSIEGITRFQKLIFLLDEETDLDVGYDFRPDNYGPFSPELYNVIETLEDRDLVNREVKHTRGGNEKFVYSLTESGRKVAKRVLEREDDVKEVFDAAQEVKQKHNDQSLERLLRYVYNKYPDYTSETKLDI